MCTPNLVFKPVVKELHNLRFIFIYFYLFIFNNFSLCADIDPTLSDYRSCSTVCFLSDQKERNNAKELLHRREGGAPKEEDLILMTVRKLKIKFKHRETWWRQTL